MAGVKGKSGGARPGAGRKPKPEQKVKIAAKNEPLEFLESVMRNDEVDMTLRVRAAGLAAPFRHPKKGESTKGEDKKRAARKVCARPGPEAGDQQRLTWTGRRPARTGSAGLLSVNR